MKRLFISDIHLGNPLFESSLIISEILMETRWDEIYFNGDIYDVWEDDFENIKKKYSGLTKLIKERSKDTRTFYILGNHDPDVDEIRATFPHIIVRAKSSFNNTLVMHGHIFDDVITKYYTLARILYFIQWFLERFRFDTMHWFRETLHSISNKREKSFYNDLVTEVEERAVEYCRESGYKNIILGHTHLPKIIKLNKGGVSYINSGDWIHNKKYVVEEDGEFKIRKG